MNRIRLLVAGLATACCLSASATQAELIKWEYEWVRTPASDAIIPAPAVGAGEVVVT